MAIENDQMKVGGTVEIAKPASIEQANRLIDHRVYDELKEDSNPHVYLRLNIEVYPWVEAKIPYVAPDFSASDFPENPKSTNYEACSDYFNQNLDELKEAIKAEVDSLITMENFNGNAPGNGQDKQLPHGIKYNGRHFASIPISLETAKEAIPDSYSSEEFEEDINRTEGTPHALILADSKFNGEQALHLKGITARYPAGWRDERKGDIYNPTLPDKSEEVVEANLEEFKSILEGKLHEIDHLSR